MSEALFASALMHPDQGCPPGLRAHNGSDPGVRFDVYRNNVVTSLVGALSETCPVTRQLVGEEFFKAVARLFIIEHPPTSPLLCDYGDAFATFIESFAPAATVPYLADMARLERSRVRAYHAADAAPLSGEEIAAQLSNPTSLAESHVEFHPSAQILRSDYAIASLWAAHHGHGEIEHVDPSSPEAALVLREDDDASVVRVPLASAVFFRSLIEGAALAQSAAEADRAAATLDHAFDLAASLGILIRHHALTAWRHPLESSP
jgi:hypothetical protein